MVSPIINVAPFPKRIQSDIDQNDDPPSPTMPEHHPPAADPTAPSRGDAFDAFVQASNPNHPDYPIWVERFGTLPRRAKGSVASASTGRRSSFSAHAEEASASLPRGTEPSSLDPAQSSRNVRRRASAADTRSRYGSQSSGQRPTPIDNDSKRQAIMQDGAEGSMEARSNRAEETPAARAARRARRKARLAEKGKAKAPPPPVPPPRASSTLDAASTSQTVPSTLLPFPATASGSSSHRGSSAPVIPPRGTKRSLVAAPLPPRTSSVQYEMPPASSVVISAPGRGQRASIDAMVELARSSEVSRPEAPPASPPLTSQQPSDGKSSGGKSFKSALFGTFRMNTRGKKSPSLKGSPSVDSFAVIAPSGAELLQVQDTVFTPPPEVSAEPEAIIPPDIVEEPPAQTLSTFTSHRLSRVIDVSDTESRFSTSRRRSRLVGDDTEDGDEFFDAHSDEGDEGEEDDAATLASAIPPISLRKRRSSLKKKRRDKDSSAAVLPSLALSGAEATLERPDSPDEPLTWSRGDPLRRERDLLAQAKKMREQQRTEAAAAAAAAAAGRSAEPKISPPLPSPGLNGTASAAERRRAVYEQNTFFLPASHPMPDLASMESASRAPTEDPYLHKQASRSSLARKLSLSNVRRPSSAGNGQGKEQVNGTDVADVNDRPPLTNSNERLSWRTRKLSVGKPPKVPAKERQSFDAAEKPLPSAPLLPSASSQPRRPSLNLPRSSTELWHRNLLTEAVGLAERHLGRRPSMQNDGLDDMDVADQEQTIRKTLSPRLLVEDAHETDSVGRSVGKSVQGSLRLGEEDAEHFLTADSTVVDGGGGGGGIAANVRPHGVPIESIDEVDEETRRSRELLSRYYRSSRGEGLDEVDEDVAQGEEAQPVLLEVPQQRTADADGSSMKSHGRTMPKFSLRSSSASLRRSFSQEQRNLPVPSTTRSVHSGSTTPVGGPPSPTPRLFGGLRAKLGGGNGSRRPSSSKQPQGISSTDMHFHTSADSEAQEVLSAEAANNEVRNRHERQGSLAAVEEATRMLQLQTDSMVYTPTPSFVATPTEREAPRGSFESVPPLPNGHVASLRNANAATTTLTSGSATSSEGGAQHFAQASSTPPTSASVHHHQHQHQHSSHSQQPSLTHSRSTSGLRTALSPTPPPSSSSPRSRSRTASSGSQKPELRSFEDMLRSFGQTERQLLSEISSKVSSSTTRRSGSGNESASAAAVGVGAGDGPNGHAGSGSSEALAV